MKFSTKAEYGLKAMVNLAQAYPNQRSAKEIAEIEHISIKYLERLLSMLLKQNLIRSQKGKSGGYILASDPQKTNVGAIIELLEGPIAPMKCVVRTCAIKNHCPSSLVWDKLGKQIRETLYSMNLSDLINQK